MLKNEKAIVAGFLAGSCLLTIGSLYLYSYKDMTGVPYDEIAAYQAQYPYKNISYTVIIEGGDEPLELNQSTRSVTLTDGAQATSLAENTDYLQKVTEIRFAAEPTAQQTLTVLTAFPHADVQFDSVCTLGKSYSADCHSINLAEFSSADMDEAVTLIHALPSLETVVLNDANGQSNMTLDDVLALHEACPNVFLDYTFELFGQTVNTGMETLEYFKADIGGDSGLDTFRDVVTLMPNLTYLKLDWCGTSNEATAQLRDELADQVKVVWRVFFSEYNCLTDTYKIWANWTVTDYNSQVLQYCTEVKYLDLGHTKLSKCDFVRYMPDLEVVIFGDTYLRSLEPLRECKKITFLEIFASYVSDLGPLADLTELRYLNIGNTYAGDLSPLYELEHLIKLNAITSASTQAQIDEFRAHQPQCDATFRYEGDCTSYGWRRDIYGHLVPRYALLRQQIGYDTYDYSRYPTGYVTEEITYESTGITPPEAEQ